MTRAKEIFLDALERPAPERQRYISLAAGDDARLRDLALGLLHAHDRAAGFMAEPTADSARPGGPAWTERPGARIGRYTIERVLGEGGFGTVYLASQTVPFERHVALKVVKPGVSSREIIHRFEAERQALAVMDHPGIAKVYDAGASEQGHPYFAMEHVEGSPITEFCDRNGLPIESRLELFERVCLAVQHAHHKGVVHRDLKPSNVLVTMIDGQPHPKVIDFGIAKAIGPQFADQTAITRASEFLGTPQYMAPEQAGMDGGDIDTRADVYSLGVILYELLAGRPPFDGARFAGIGYSQLIRILREEEPPRPSVRVGRLEDEAEPVAAARATEPARLVRVLSEDLDWIVMRALEKDRARRYPTASALAADVRRFLRNEPVEAGPPTAGYRFSKFARRHRAAITAGGCVAAALLAGLVLAVIGLVEARAQQRAAAASLAEAETVTTFLADLLASADPGRLGRDVLVVDVLDRAASNLDTAFADRPRTEIRVRDTIGRTYLQLGRYEPAERHARRAHTLAQRHLARTDPLRLQATLALGQALLRQDKRHEAGLVIGEALEVASLQEDSRGPNTLRGKMLLGELHELGGDLKAAEAALGEALDGRRCTLGSEHPETLVSMADLASNYMAQGRVDEALPLCETVLEVRRRIFGDDHPDTLSAMNNLAEVHLHRRGPAEAEALWREALAGYERVVGPEHPDTLIVRNNLANACAYLDRYDECESLLARNLEIQRRVLGPEHRHTLTTMHNLAAINGYLGRREKEYALKLEVYELRRHAYGPDHPDTLSSEKSLAGYFHALGRHEDAIPLLEHVTRIYRETLAPEDARRIDSIFMLAESYVETGRLADARPLVLERQAGKKINADRPDATLGELRTYAEDLLACVPEDLRRPADALPYLQRAHALTDGQNVDILEGLALALERTGDAAAALAAIERALPLAPPDSEIAARLRDALARLRPPE